jgi:hypothetical protein
LDSPTIVQYENGFIFTNNTKRSVLLYTALYSCFKYHFSNFAEKFGDVVQNLCVKIDNMWYWIMKQKPDSLTVLGGTKQEIRHEIDDSFNKEYEAKV